MKMHVWLMVAILGLTSMAQAVRAELGHRVGAGVNYWTMLDDVDEDNFDEHGVSWLATYQYKFAPLLAVEADVEFFGDGFEGIDGSAFAPEAYLVLGSAIYAAAGIGVLHAGGDFADDPFYALRAGLNLEILPSIYLDLNVNYRFADTSDLSETAKDIDSDTLMLGAAVRFGL